MAEVPLRIPPPRHNLPRVGQVWTDATGQEARVLAVVEGYVMLRCQRRNPFLKQVATLSSGRDGWRRLP